MTVTDFDAHSETITVTVSAGSPPAAPTLTVSVSGTTLTLGWTPIEGATGYNLLYAPPDLSFIGQADVGTFTGGSFEMSSGASLYVAVQAYNTAGTSSFSNVGFFAIP